MLKLTIITPDWPHWHSFFVILEHTFSSVSVADVEQVNVSLTGHAFYLPHSPSPPLWPLVIRGFLMFSGGIKTDQWHEVGWKKISFASKLKQTSVYFVFVKRKPRVLIQVFWKSTVKECDSASESYLNTVAALQRCSYIKRCSGNMQQIYWWTSMQKRDIYKVAKQKATFLKSHFCIGVLL